MIKNIRNSLFLACLLIFCVTSVHAYQRGSSWNENDLEMQKNSIVFDELASTPDNPPANKIKMYAKDDGAGTTTPYALDSSGTETSLLGGGSSGAPVDATYITQTANATLSGEQALGALSTGIMYNTTTTGVVSTIPATVQFAIQDAENLTTHAGRSTQSACVWYNGTGKTFTITKIRAMSDTDDYTFLLFKSSSNTDISTGADTQLDSVACSTDGTSGYYANIISGFDVSTIETAKYLIFEHSSGTSENVQIAIEGTYS